MNTGTSNDPEISGGTPINSAQEAQKNAEVKNAAEQQSEPRVRAIPNIPRRAQDPLPERPERGGSSGSNTAVILLVLAFILVMIFLFLKK